MIYTQPTESFNITAQKLQTLPKIQLESTMAGQFCSHLRKTYVPPISFILILYVLFNVLDRIAIDLGTNEDELIYDNHNENQESLLVEWIEMPSWRSALWKITEKPDKPPDSVLFWHIPKV